MKQNRKETIEKEKKRNRKQRRRKKAEKIRAKWAGPLLGFFRRRIPDPSYTETQPRPFWATLMSVI